MDGVTAADAVPLHVGGIALFALMLTLGRPGAAGPGRHRPARESGPRTHGTWVRGPLSAYAGVTVRV